MNTTIDPWNRIIEEFFALTKIEAKISNFGKKYKIEIYGYEDGLDEWIDETLSKWDDVTKVQKCWVFENKNNAQKFLTLFNLKWAT